MVGIRTLLYFITISLILNGCAKQQEHPLQGAWKMESGIYTEHVNDQRIETDSESRFSIKIMSREHFAVVEMFKEKPDSLFFAAVGTFKLTKNKYIEKYEASNVGYQVGTSREFQYSLENDIWTISQLEKDIELHEVWSKMQ